MTLKTWKNLGLYRTLRALFFVKPVIDGSEFIDSWENTYGKFHDPSPQEVIERLKFLKLYRVMELGSGYGRIAIPLASSGFKVTCIEPDKLLAVETKDKDIFTLVSKIQDLPLLRDQFKNEIDCVISVRVISYLSLLDTIRMLRYLQKFSPIFIGWEEYVGSRRLRLARFFVRKISVVVIESLN